MSDGEEIELKLQLDPADIATLLANPLFSDRGPATRDQTSTYFDTERHALDGAGLSLRIRASGGKRTQTIKTESAVAASLFARGEWEREMQSDTPDLEDAPAILIEALGKQGARALAPIFTVEINRTSAIHDEAGNRVEIVADRGQVVVDGKTGAIAEIELELLDGSRTALFALAHRVALVVPVRLGVQSKSGRGYALLRGKQALSVKAEPISLSRDIDTATLFETVAGACLRQFRLNEDKLLGNGAPAALHQARVGLRRLRSALSIFRKMLAGPEFDRFQAEFRTLAGQLGRVRDVDVMIAKIEHEPALDRLRTARDERYRSVVATLDSAAVRTLMLDFVAWLSIGEWRDREDGRELRDVPALVTAGQTLDRLRRRIKRPGEKLSALDEHDRHQVRIAGKKLRYAAEFFSDFYRGKKAAKRRDAFLEAIEDLQTALGHLNDLASGRALFEELGIADADAILATGKKSDRKRLLADADDAVERLVETKRFWR